MAVLKPKYELSVWNEELIDGIKVEKQGIIIGGHDMTHLGRAVNVRLKKEVKGKNTLTFQMPTKFFNSEIGDFVKNELIEDLYNERKIKLHHITRDEWYEFYIKEISEEKLHKAIMKTFTCTDSFIEELSRTGYEKEFTPDLNNSVQSIGDFTEEILDGSIWDYRPEYNWGDFTEYREERFYKIPLSLFGGSICAYPIDLEILDVAELSCAGAIDIPLIENVHTHEKRNMEYGDDLARNYNLYWDPYETDNGRELLNEKVTLTSDYIYVPMSDLTFIMGSVYESNLYAVETPAYYGSYSDGNTSYALLPVSQNPRDLILFICFLNGDTVLTDEVNTLVNTNCHYVLPIEEWNSLLAARMNKKESCIYWTGLVSSDYTKSLRYDTALNGDILYTVNVKPSTSTIDDLNWYPVYYEGYLDKIGDLEITYARRINITDRTELNVNQDTYTTVYNNKAGQYNGMYSNEELQGQDLRVTSKLDTQQILPTLARNFVENGTNITLNTGWEAKTLNNNELDILGTGSFKKLLEINVRSINLNGELVELSNLSGLKEDEEITNYYLEFLSPIVEKTDDFNLLGTVYSDYALNFGAVGQERKIEKGKIYAIRIKTGEWITDDEGNSYFNETYNIDLNKVIIGAGATNSKGNYIIEGIDAGEHYISFADIFNLNLTYSPSGESGSLTQTLYRIKTSDNNWKWSTLKPVSGTYIEDNCFVLFKATKTIENPYIAIRVDSNPLDIEASYLSSTSWSLNDGRGARINVIMPKSSDLDISDLAHITDDILENYSYVEGIKILFCLIDTNNFADSFLERCGYDKDTGLINVLEGTVIELKEGEFLNSSSVIDTTQSYITVPLYDTAICGETGDLKSKAKAIFINDEFYGIYWFEKKEG